MSHLDSKGVFLPYEKIQADFSDSRPPVCPYYDWNYHSHGLPDYSALGKEERDIGKI